MKKLLPYLAGLVVVILLLASIPLFFLQPDRYRPQVAEYLSQLCGQSVMIGKMSASYYPPTLHLEHMTVANAQQTFLDVEQVDVLLNFSALLKFKVIPQGLLFLRPMVSVVRNPDRTWAWPLQQGTRQSLQAALRNWSVQSIHIQSGELHFMDPLNGQTRELVFQDIDADVSDHEKAISAMGKFIGLTESMPFEFHAKGHFGSSPDFSSELTLNQGNQRLVLKARVDEKQLNVTGESKSWSWDSALQAAQFFSRCDLPKRSTGVLLEQWGFEVQALSTETKLSQQATLSGGKMEFQGTIAAHGSGSVLKGAMAFKGVGVSALEKMILGTSQLEGTLTGIVSPFSIALSTDCWSTVSATGGFEIMDGKVRWSEALSKSVRKAKTMTYMKKKFPGFPETPLPFQKMTGHFVAQKGLVMTDAGSFRGASIRAGYQANVDLVRHGLDGYLRVRIQETDPSLRKELPVKYRTVPLNGRFQGTVEEFTLKSVPSVKIPGRVSGQLNQGLKK